MKNYDEVLPSKWGKYDEEPSPSQDVTQAVGATEQEIFMYNRKEDAQNAVLKVSNALYWRMNTLRHNLEEEARHQIMSSMYAQDFNETVLKLLDDAEHLCTVPFRNL